MPAVIYNASPSELSLCRISSSCLSLFINPYTSPPRTYIDSLRVHTPVHGLGHASHTTSGFDPGLVRNTHRIPHFTIIGFHELLYRYLNRTCILVCPEYFLNRPGLHVVHGDEVVLISVTNRHNAWESENAETILLPPLYGRTQTGPRSVHRLYLAPRQSLAQPANYLRSTTRVTSSLAQHDERVLRFVSALS